MRPFTRLPLCLALFTFILSGCIQNRCSLPEFEGVCQDKPSDMTMSDQNSSDGCTPSNTNEQTFKFNDITEPHTIHAISMIDDTSKSIIAFNLINEKEKTFYIIAYNKSDPCSSRRRFGQFKIPSQELHTQGISASADGFSFDANFENNKRQHYNITSEITITSPLQKDNQAWSMNSGMNGTLHVLVEGHRPTEWHSINQLLSVSSARDFDTTNQAPKLPPDMLDISKVVIGTLSSNSDGILAWSTDGNQVYFSPITMDSTLANGGLSFPAISGCGVSMQNLCPVAMDDITGDTTSELIIAKQKGIIVHRYTLSATAARSDIIIPTKTAAQAVSVSINNDKNMRKLIWASSKFENNKNTVTIHTIPVSSIM